MHIGCPGMPTEPALMASRADFIVGSNNSIETLGVHYQHIDIKIHDAISSTAFEHDHRRLAGGLGNGCLYR